MKTDPKLKPKVTAPVASPRARSRGCAGVLWGDLLLSNTSPNEFSCFGARRVVRGVSNLSFQILSPELGVPAEFLSREM